MGSRVYDNDTNVSTVIDNRNAAGDNALLAVNGTITKDSNNHYESHTTNTQNTANSGNTGSYNTTNNTQTTSNSGNTTSNSNNTTTNTQTLTNSGNTTTTSNSNNTTTNTQNVQNTTVESASILEFTKSIPKILSNNNAFASDMVTHAFDTVEQGLGGVLSTQEALSKMVSLQGDAQRGFATGLVQDVLKATQSGDERQTENFLKYMVIAVGILAAALTLPKFAKG